MKSPLFYTVESARIIADTEDFGNVLELIIVIPEDDLAPEELKEALAVEDEYPHGKQRMMRKTIFMRPNRYQLLVSTIGNKTTKQ